METSALKYGLCDSRTIEYSQELDLLLNKVMKIRYTGLKQFKRLNGLSGGTEDENNKTIPTSTSRKPWRNSCPYLPVMLFWHGQK
ncbi:aspartyl-phosphate phosphatase Spo0E family protein [Peribacillus butanolivorans]|uniref:aspartyl-phosphate phosphatase Spo0E family protein n=1 Tax=Peribacillus butanolivorans TaxID=421767 RepID=UPI00365E1270